MKQYQLTVEGLKCEHCEAKLQDDLKNAFGLKKVSASHESGLVTFKTNQDITEEDLKKAVGFHGYTLKSVSTTDVKGFFDFLRK